MASRSLRISLGVLLAALLTSPGPALADDGVQAASIDTAPTTIRELWYRQDVWKPMVDDDQYQVLPALSWHVAPISTDISICRALESIGAYSVREDCFSKAYPWRTGPGWSTPAPAVALYGVQKQQAKTTVWLGMDNLMLCLETPGDECVFNNGKSGKNAISGYSTDEADGWVGGVKRKKLPWFTTFAKAENVALDHARSICATTGSPVILVVYAHRLYLFGDDPDEETLGGEPPRTAAYLCSQVPATGLGYDDEGIDVFMYPQTFYQVKLGLTQLRVAWTDSGYDPYVACSWNGNTFRCNTYPGEGASAGTGTIELTVKWNGVWPIRYRRS